MPLYDFECFDCKKKFEHVCRVADRPEFLPCPRCGARARQVMLAAPAVHGDELLPWQRRLVGSKNVPGQLQNNRAVAAGYEKGIETRKEFYEAMKAKKITLDRDIRLDCERD